MCDSTSKNKKNGVPLGSHQSIVRYSVKFCYLEETPDHKIGWTDLGNFKTYSDIAKATGMNAEMIKAIANNRCQKLFPLIKITKLPWKEQKAKELANKRNARTDRIAANKAKKLEKKQKIVHFSDVIVCDQL
jgi:hypothetical protein